jgi:hypothetical protein
LNRSADFKYAADDRTTLMKLLSKQRQEFTERGATPPAEYTAVCDWLAAHGVSSAHQGTPYCAYSYQVCTFA